MGYAEFEEKEFEKPLYNQIENGECDVWSPGQCFEGHIGFDYSGNISSYEFWKRFGGFIPKGVILNDYNMEYVWRKMKKKRMLPNFSINLFIQAKRPYIHSGTFRGAIYNTKHYSFELNQKQQKILERLDQKLHHKALLVYAAPVFGTYEELYKHTQERTMLSNTSFPKVSALSGHTHWYYCNAYSGIAHSEPEEDETFDIFEMIHELVDENRNTGNLSFDENIYQLANIVESVSNEFEDDAQVNYFFSQVNEMKSHYEYIYYRMHTSLLYGLNIVNYSTVISFLTVSIFCDIFNLDWFVLL